MKMRKLIIVCILFTFLFAGCGQDKNKEKDISVLVSTSLTQTAAVKPTETAVQANGIIKGSIELMAPPTPPMVIYAIETTTGKWASVDTPESLSGPAEFTINLVPGTYKLVSYIKENKKAMAAYVEAEKGLGTITVNANQTVSNIVVRYPGTGDCGEMELPASPDGKYTGNPGPDKDCVATATAAAAQSANPNAGSPATPVRVQFQSGSTSWSTSGNLSGQSNVSYILGAAKGQTMTVNASFSPNSGAYFWVRTAGGIMIVQNSTTGWSGVLPANGDYVVGIDNLTQQAVQFSLTISISAVKSSNTNTTTTATDVPTAVPSTGPVNQTIRFDTEPLSITLDGAVISGQRDRYNFGVMKGEMIDVVISSTEGNAVFSIIGPDGNALLGTEEGKDINNWAVQASTEGTYSIVVGSTRGNATYKLVVNVSKFP